MLDAICGIRNTLSPLDACWTNLFEQAMFVMAQKKRHLVINKMPLIIFRRTANY